MTVLNIANFSPSPNNKIGTGAKFSHKVTRGTLFGNPKTWICKEMKTPHSARKELLSQELFRLIIPNQPETLIAENSTTKVFYILSEEISGYRNLPEGEAASFSNGHYHGLGQVMTLAMFLQEIDLKNGNIGLNDKNQVIKIDGEWCFAEFTDNNLSHNYKLTPQAIEYLPYPKDYYTYNWLDIIRKKTYQPKSRIIDSTLSNTSQFRTEVNETLLKLCLIPDRYFEQFVDQYISAGAAKYAKSMQKRQKELMESATQNLSFKAYLKTPEAQLEAKNFLNILKDFKVENTPIVSKENHIELEKEFEFQQLKLKSLIPQSKSSTETSFEQAVILKECNDLLNKIKERSHSKDMLLKQYINQFEQVLKKDSQDNAELKHLQVNIQSIEKIMNSPEILAVEKTIGSFRNCSSFFNLGKKNKANKIELALHSTPIDLRPRVISDSKVNPVQEALAAHRHLGKRGLVFKTKENTIDESQAARSFKKLRKLFKSFNYDEVNYENPPAPSL
jgi:hypothetical protein